MAPDGAPVRRWEAAMGEIELYPRTNWKRAIAIGTATMLLVGYGGYRWITTSTPVDRDAAVALFRAEMESSGEDTITESTGSGTTKSSARSRSGPPKKSASRGKPSVATTRIIAAPASSGGTATAPRERRKQASASRVPERPDEGVYSWDTDGWEQASGIRREMPKESQRIITHNSDGSYLNHHYFSEEREIWTQFRFSERGAELVSQRNKVKFGPVTNDSRIDFSPPMVVGRASMSVGMRWADTWTGDTSGDYKSHVFEHVTIRIGDEDVEVWGIEYEINLRGEQRGRVDAQVWFAPEYSLTVQEHYVQDVETDAGKYHAEWKMTLQSVHPQT